MSKHIYTELFLNPMTKIEKIKNPESPDITAFEPVRVSLTKMTKILSFVFTGLN